MQHSTREEANSRCNICAIGLSWIENYLYGNRCVVCADILLTINPFTTTMLVLVDWWIYQEIMKVRQRPDVKFILIGSLGECGFHDPNQARTIWDKFRVLIAIKGCLKRLK